MHTTLAHRIRNIVHSILLLAGMAAIAAICLGAFFGPDGALWAAIGALAGFLLGPSVPKRYLLRLYRARPIAPGELPEVHLVLQRLAERAGLPSVPELYYVPSTVPNAFALGDRRSSAIAVTDGILRLLNLRELAGVLAHEVSHIAHGDLWIMGLADVMSRVTAMLSFLGQFLLLANLPLLMVGAVTVPWTVVLLLIFAPTIMSLLQLALSRAREYDADVGAAELTGDPLGLASALAKLERHQGRFWEEILLPGRRIPDPSLLRTHPPTEERIRRLREIARARALEDAQAAFEERRVLPPPAFGPVERPRLRWHGLWY